MKRILLGFLIIASMISHAQDKFISELNPQNLNPDFSKYSQSTALFLAQISEMAYWNERNIEATKNELNRLYPDNNFQCKLIDDSYGIFDNQALLLGTKNFLVIAFRGTEPSVLKDWWSDAKYWTYENAEGSDTSLANMPPGHGGFRRSLIRLMEEKNLKAEIANIISKCNPKAEQHSFPIYLTGHSLGAALSQLFIVPLEYYKFNFAGAYHFAPPLAVSCAVNHSMRIDYGDKVYDIVNYKDYVPRAGRNGVAHFGKFYRICDDGLVYEEKEAYVKFNRNEYFTEFKLHSLATHIERLRDTRNNFNDIISRSINMGDFPCMELKGKALDLCGD